MLADGDDKSDGCYDQQQNKNDVPGVGAAERTGS
jgi:hypothetical protein